MPVMTDTELHVLGLADALAKAERMTTLDLALTLKSRAHNDGGLTNDEWAMAHVLAGRVIKVYDALRTTG